MSSDRISLGKKGEQLVAFHLKKQGFTILATNYQKKMGEIDIIAQKDELMVFVEVKVRSHAYMYLSDIIPISKRHKIIQTARLFIMDHNLENTIYRFDAALLEPSGADYSIRYFENAFTSYEL